MAGSIHTKQSRFSYALSFSFKLIFRCVGGCILPACIYIYSHLVQQKPEEDAGYPELDLHIVVSHYIDTGNWTRILWKSNKSSLPLSHHFSPVGSILMWAKIPSILLIINLWFLTCIYEKFPQSIPSHHFFTLYLFTLRHSQLSSFVSEILDLHSLPLSVTMIL